MLQDTLEVYIENMHPISSLSGGIEFFSAIITLVILIGNISERNKHGRLGKCFRSLLIAHFFMQFSDAFIWFLLDIPEVVLIVRVLNQIAYIAAISVI